MLIQLDKWAFKPVRKWVRDAGWDLLSPETITIQPHSYYEIDTGVHFAIPRGYVGMVKTKSSFIKQHVLTEGVVDSGYIGSVHVFINNMSDNSLSIERGQKVAQIVFLPIYEVGNMEVVENLQDFEVKRREELVALAQLVNDLDKTVAILNGFCDGCVMSHTCKKNCNRMTTLSNLVNDYIKLSNAYDVVCSELTLGSQYFMNSTKEEVKEHFYNG